MQLVRSLSLAASALSLLSTSLAFSGVVVIPVGDANMDLRPFESAHVIPKGYSVVHYNINRFENENTVIQIYPSGVKHEGVKVTNQDVYIAIPSVLDYDLLMQALIKTHTAKTFGAASVKVASVVPFSSVKIVGNYSEMYDLRALFAIAGADTGLPPLQPIKNRVSNHDYWIAGSNNPELAHSIAAKLGKTAFSFDDLKNRSSELSGRQIYWVASARPVNTQLLETLAQIRWLSNQGASVHLISPYLPYARSDKPDQRHGESAQGRLIAKLIESMGTQGITVVRAHAPQSLGFFDIHTREISSRDTIIEYLKSQDIECIISPDAGFQKDATKYAKKLSKAYRLDGKPREVFLAVMNKARDHKGIETLKGGTGLENIAGKKAVIIDDETASGGTLGKVAKFINTAEDGKYKPASIFAVVTHLAGDAKGAFNSPLEQIVVTDTVPVKYQDAKLKVLSIADEIAKDIKEVEANRN